MGWTNFLNNSPFLADINATEIDVYIEENHTKYSDSQRKKDIYLVNFF